VQDVKGNALAYASVMILATQWGAFSKEDGAYEIPFVPVGTYTVRVNLIGYEDQTVEDVKVERGQTTTVDFKIKEKPLGTVPEVQVVARREVIKQKETGIEHDNSGKRAGSLPVDQTADLLTLKAGVIARGGELHFRGGRGGEARFEVSAPAARANVPVEFYTGGNALPNDEPYDAMFFQHYGVNPFIPADEDALSTFAVDVDNASYTVMRRYVELGNLPPKDAVRLEEFVNFFRQGYPRFETPDFRILVDGAPSPFGAGYHLMRVGIRGRMIDERDRKPATLVFVVDVSGSMAREDRLELVKRALGLLVDRLRPGDEVGIVVYGSEGRVLLHPVRIGEDDFAEDPDWRDDRERSDRGRDDERWNGEGEDGDVRFRPANLRPPRRSDARERILASIESLHPEGSTNAEEGIRLGYEMARSQYRPGAINRILLCSDGVANVGRTGPESILKQIRDEADRGIMLTTVGFGMGNYNDVLMEQLADRGDGSYYYVDDLDEARRVFVENLTGTLQTIARDAKVQVEFDPKRVLRYRLLGFENRDVADRDFRNDKVDAGEIGAGHEVTALYEVKLAEGVESGTLATVRFRYARPERDLGEGPRVREIEERFDAASLHDRFRDAAPEFRLDAAVAEFAEILRGSFWAKESRIEDVEPIARAAAEDLGTDEAREFVRIVRKAEGLSATVEPDPER
jgi:Ca-activated chloride channel family protein